MLFPWFGIDLLDLLQLYTFDLLYVYYFTQIADDAYWVPYSCTHPYVLHFPIV